MNKLSIILVLFFIFAPLSNVSAYGEIKGTSLGEFSSCDYYLIEDSSGSYSLVEWYGGITPYSGNTVVGELHSYGFKDLYNISRDNSTRVWIDDWLLSEDSAAEKLIDKCGYDRSISTYFDSGGYYIPSYTPPVTSAPTCPTNSSSVNGQCACDSGYKASGNACITATQSCQNQYGSNSYGDGQYCYCSTGYQWNIDKTQCVQIPTCSEGYVMNANNLCITYTQDCQTFHNDPNMIGAKGDNGGSNCFCKSGYSWDGDKCSVDITSVSTEKIIKNITDTTPSFVDFQVPDQDIEFFRAKGIIKSPAIFRKCPSKNCSIIRYYAETSQVDIIGKYKKDNWYKIDGRIDAGGNGQKIQGWISQSVFGKVSSFENTEKDMRKNKEPTEKQEAISTQAESEKVKKLRWYQRIFNWFKKK